MWTYILDIYAIYIYICSHMNTHHIYIYRYIHIQAGQEIPNKFCYRLESLETPMQPSETR